MNYALCIVLASCNPNSGGPTYFNDVESVSAWTFYTIAIKTDDSLWAWGGNGGGQLGNGSVGGLNDFPVKIEADKGWKAVSAGGDHTVAIKTDGSLWAWGNNAWGQLGDGSGTSKNTPQPIGANKWKAVSARGDHTVAIRSDDTLWAWGGNGSGQLGNGSAGVSITTPVQLTGIYSGYTWKAVSAGHYYTVAIRSDDTIWAWGANGKGQLGDPTITNFRVPNKIGVDKWKAVSAGESHTVAIRSDDTLWAWGANDKGQLGDGTTTNRDTPQQVGGTNKWKAVSAGFDHTVAIKSDDILWAWGGNDKCQLGDGTIRNSLTPKRVLQVGD